jgi:hypothetical protein
MVDQRLIAASVLQIDEQSDWYEDEYYPKQL